VLVNMYSLRTYEPGKILAAATLERTDLRKQGEKEMRLVWQHRLADIDTTRTAEIAKVAQCTKKKIRKISGVPYYDWSYGCSPTAAAMVLGYWDSHGYDNLVDYYFWHHDIREGDWDYIPNVQRELAIAMQTDTTSGATDVGDIGPGIEHVTNSINGYSFSAPTTWWAFYTPYGTYDSHWSTIVAEIDRGRPLVWNVFDYTVPPGQPNAGLEVNHSVTVIGYRKDTQGHWYWPYDKWWCKAIVHNTWDYQEHY